ncbi:MAG: hypothetical protein AB1384_06175 [Actinomycetota bacterium]
MREDGAPSGLIFAAGVCSEVAGLEEGEARRYAVELLREFFRKKGRGLEVQDYGRMLRRTIHHINRNIAEKWPGQEIAFDLVVMIADIEAVFAARSGNGGCFIFHEGEARAVFKGGVEGVSSTAGAPPESIEVEAARIQPGDIAVLCDPIVSRVLGPRDVTLILRRASDPAKAALFLSAIAERKGAGGPITALIWEVPNYEGAALLTDETLARAPEPGEDTGGEERDEESSAELAKRQWLSKWRRRKE